MRSLRFWRRTSAVRPARRAIRLYSVERRGGTDGSGNRRRGGTDGSGRVEVGRWGSVRTLYFVRASGERVTESQVDLAAPHRLLLPYTQLMMAGLLYADERPPRRALLIGLGGGGMLHFMNRVFPKTALDVVELQPRIVQLAQDEFGVRPASGSRLIVSEGSSFVAAQPDSTYDVIFIDGFLHPDAPGTDPSGVPADLKGTAFLRNLKRIASRNGGVIVFNLNEGPHTRNDLLMLRQTFPNLRIVRHDGNIVVISLPFGKLHPASGQEMQRRAALLDQHLPSDSTFAFRQFVA